LTAGSHSRFGPSNRPSQRLSVTVRSPYHNQENEIMRFIHLQVTQEVFIQRSRKITPNERLWDWGR